MSTTLKKCYICLNIYNIEYLNITDLDEDQISYLEKLQSICSNLIEINPMELCMLCIKDLRVAYKFKNLVLMSQETLLRESRLEVDDLLQSIKEEDMLMDTIKAEDALSESKIGDYDQKICNTVENNTEENYSLSEDDSQKKRNYSKLGEDVVNCDVCGKIFNKLWLLRKHINRVHDPKIKHICSICNKEFKQSFHLKEHMTKHTGEKNYSCSICGKKFQRHSSQRRHEKGHDRPPGEKSKRTPFLCTICGKSFPFSNGVQRHMRIHLGIKNFQCKICNKKFAQSTHLHVHMRKHTGEKPYVCDNCGENFSLKSVLVKHIQKLHPRNR